MPAILHLQIVAGYAAVLGLVFVVLSAMTIRARGRARIMLGDGGDAYLEKCIRAHGNFAEYVPLALILTGGAAIAGAPPWVLHAAGIVLIVGRLLHARAIHAGSIRLRVAGMVATFATIAGTSLYILAKLAIDG